MIRFSELTEQQILGLSSDKLADAIKIEAINRGIKIPVPLSEAIQLSGFKGHEPTKADVTVYRLGGDSYNDSVGWLTEEQALRAQQGAVMIGSNYKQGRSVPCVSGDAVIVKRVILPGEPQTFKMAKLEEYVNDQNDEYDVLVAECVERVRIIRQEAYDLNVARERKAEYMRLANNDVAIAKAFWAKAETLAWPDGVGE
jgi:hypothetical protein